MPGVAAQLVAALGTEQVTTDPAVTTGYAHDEAEWAPSGTPAALVRPRDTADVATTARICAETGTPWSAAEPEPACPAPPTPPTAGSSSPSNA
ncbi:hypothetical protein ACFQXA_06240 [Nocardiopsis composta]